MKLDAGNVEALADLAGFLLAGRGGPKDIAQARRLLEKGAAEKDRAAITALGPGTGTAAKPAARTAATMRAPGSQMPGVPASEISATCSPRESRATIACAAACSLCSCADSIGVRMPQASSSRWLWRVSSAAIQSTPASTARARGLRSARFPKGVATT